MSVREKIARRLEREEPGWVFTPADFARLGSPQSVGVALLRLLREGRIRRVARGLYDVPREHRLLGTLAPRPAAVIAALKRRYHVRIEPHEALAANELRLSDQVPARLFYLTDGPARTFTVDGVTYVLQHRSQRKLASAGRMSAMVFAALRGIGRRHVTRERVAHLHELLGPADRRRLLEDLPQAEAWMRPYLRFIASGKDDA